MPDSFTHNNSISRQKPGSYSKYYLYLIGLIWSQSLFEYFRGFFTHVPIIGDLLAPFIVPVTILLLLIYTSSYTKRFFSVSDFLFIGLVMIIYASNILFHPENEEILHYYLSTLFLGTLPFYLLGIIVNLDERTENIIYWTSIIGLFVLITYFLIYIRNSSYLGDTKLSKDMMGPAYATLPFELIIIRKMLSHFNIINLVISIVGFIFIISLGTRGPLFCIFVYALFYLLLLKKYQKPILSKTLIILTGGLCLAFLNELLILFIPLIEVLGMSTRVLEYTQAIVLFGNSEFADASILGRQDLFAIVLNHVGLWGNGIGAFGTISQTGVYTHNIIADFLIEYGVLLGTLLIILILSLYRKSWAVAKTETEKSFVLLLFCMSFVHLLFSHTYLIVPEFFLSIGYCVHVIRESKKGRVSI